MRLQDRMLEMLEKVFNADDIVAFVDDHSRKIAELITQGHADYNKRAQGKVPRKTYGKQPFTPEVPPLVLDDDGSLFDIGDAETAR